MYNIIFVINSFIKCISSIMKIIDFDDVFSIINFVIIFTSLYLSAFIFDISSFIFILRFKASKVVFNSFS